MSIGFYQQHERQRQVLTIASNVAPSITTQAVLTSDGLNETGAAYTITPPIVTGTPTPTITYQFQVDGVNNGATFTGLTGNYPATAGVVTLDYVVSKSDSQKIF